MADYSSVTSHWSVQCKCSDLTVITLRACGTPKRVTRIRAYKRERSGRVYRSVKDVSRQGLARQNFESSVGYFSRIWERVYSMSKCIQSIIALRKRQIVRDPRHLTVHAARPQNTFASLYTREIASCFIHNASATGNVGKWQPNILSRPALVQLDRKNRTRQTVE